MSSTCNRCGLSITWKKPFTQGDRPLNLDNSAHTCVKPEESKPETKTTLKTPNTALSEVIEFYETFKEIDAAKLDSLARIYNTLRMKR